MNKWIYKWFKKKTLHMIEVNKKREVRKCCKN